jgi:8-oxo-dGTP diphosphatase
MVARDGDGWIECHCGSRHWGLHGAAGLLLFRSGKVLLQLRAPWVHNGGTWGIPGGARDSHEEWGEAAIREAIEEIGIEATMIDIDASLHYSDDHGLWRYETIIAPALENFALGEANHETVETQWFDFGKIEDLPLHASFAKAWPSIKALIESSQ